MIVIVDIGEAAVGRKREIGIRVCVGGNEYPFAGCPNLQPEIQKNRWKSAEVAELFCLCGKFQIFS
jgi:hypothetical protein